MDFVKKMGQTILGLKHRLELSMVSPESTYKVGSVPSKPSLVNPYGQRLELNVSAPCKIRLMGNHLVESLDLAVE